MFRLPKLLTDFILLLTLSTFIFYPQGHLFAQPYETSLKALPEPSEMTYDDVMTLLDDFESGAIECKYSPKILRKL